MPKTLFLIDAYAMIYKAYYAFISNPMMNSKGESTSAVFGFVNSLQDILKKENPSHIAVVFDPPYPTFRNDMSPEYKAQRPPTPEGIKTGIPHIKDILDAWGIHRVEVPRYEADDTIGTLAGQAAAQGFAVYMVTPDKDYKQLLKGDSIMLYRPKKGSGYDIITEKDFMEETGLENPGQFIDILALWGDAADNVKGVTGIGEKTAYKLISQYKSMEGIYENIDKLKGKQKENFVNDREVAILAKKLVTIDTNAPIDFVESDFLRKDINEDSLRGLFTELEFKTLADRLIGKKAQQQQLDFGAGTLFSGMNAAPAAEPKPASKMKTVKDVPHEYILVETDEQICSLRDQLQGLKEFCFDTETTGLSVHSDLLVGMSFAYEDHKAYFIHFDHNNDAETRRRLSLIAPALENPGISKIGQNIKFDIMVLRHYGVSIRGQIFDTMVAHYLLQPEQKHNMDYLSEVYLEYTPVHIEQLIGEKGKNQKNMGDVEAGLITEYAAEDADVTWQLYGKLRPLLEQNGMLKLAQEIEMPLIYVLADMEYTGVRVDTDFLGQYTSELNAKADEVEQLIYKCANGKVFNIASPKQLGEVLFDELKISDNPTRTKTGTYATGEDELLKYKDNEIVGHILEYRGLKKLVSTYTDALPGLVNPDTGRIHTSFNQTVTATGRLSSSNPNIQNIPIRTPEGKRVREAFVPSEGNIMYAADYSQVELRVMAHMSGDENMISAFQNDEDIHRSTASRIFHVDAADVTREQRSHAKSANFGIIYGISAFGLSQDTGLSRSEAKEVIDSYFATYPGIRQYIDATIAGCRQNHYVSTMFGHRREIMDRDINSANFTVRNAAERLAVNTPVQGTAAEIIKIAMVNIFRVFQERGIRSKLLIQVHDELVFDVVPEEKELVEQIVVAEMENAAQLKVRLKVEGKFADNWLLAH